jgi:hypothetical protein
MFVAVVSLVVAASAAAAAQPGPAPGSRAWVESLKPEWSRPVGGKTRFVGVEEYGRCSVFVDDGVIQVVAPSGAVSWTWPFRKISKYINPRDVAVSHDCNAIALVGDASYKYGWIAERGGGSVSLPFMATPADIEFDRTGDLVAVGTFAGSIHLFSRLGQLQWKRDTEGAIVGDLEFTDDNRRIVFRGWGGAGVVSVAGQVEWSGLSNRLAASRDLSTFVFGSEPSHGPGLPRFHVADAGRKELWMRWGSVVAFVSATGDRILATVDKEQQKKEADFFGEPQASAIQLLARDGSLVTSLDDYRWAVALSEDGSRAWVGSDDGRGLNCVNDRGEVLATIETKSFRDVMVSRDFGQVLIVTEKDLHPVSVERYVVPPPCGR